MNFSWASKKWFTILLHIAFWVLLFSLPSLLRPARDTTQPEKPENAGFFFQYLVNFFSWICLFYVNAYILIPKLIYQKKYVNYALAHIPLFVVLFLLNWTTFRLF